MSEILRDQATEDHAMQYDIVMMLATSLVFSIKAAPLVVLGATLIRSLILLSGNKRVFRAWTRNAMLSAITIFFAPGAIINTAVRYSVCSLFRIDIKGIAVGSTYAELNLFLKVDSPPRVGVLVSALFVSTIASIFIGFALLFLPVVYLAGAPVLLLSWYLSAAVLFNSSLRGGDVSLLGAALQKHPGKGVAELILALSVLIVFYIILGTGVAL